MDRTVVTWKGEDGYIWHADLGIDGATPCIFELSYERCGERLVLGKMLHPQFKVITSKRTTHNPQREKPVGVDEASNFQWDTYSDDPMSRKEFVQEATDVWNSTKLEVTQDGNVTHVLFDGLTLGKFKGGCRFNFFNGSNLIRIEAVASTEENGVAYLYHAGLDGFTVDKLYYISPNRKEIYENPGLRTNSGPDRDRQRVDARNRVLTLAQPHGAFAVFPPPHRFFWGSQTENIVGFNYYNLDRNGNLAIGVRHNMEAEHHNVRWPCYNAKPGTVQNMSFFICVSSDSVWTTRAMVMKYTNFDHLRKLNGYQRLCAHMHVATHAAWMRDQRAERPWERLLKEMGCDIFAPCDFWAEGRCEDNKDGRKEDLERYHAMAKCCSTPDFLVIPAEELAVMSPDKSKMLVPYHCMVMPSKPLLYSRWRDDDQEFAEVLPDGRTYYHLKSADDLIEMCRRENSFILMPHPDTKANDGLPYDVKDKAWFQDHRWFGIGTRMLPADNSYKTMIDGRTTRVWNDINNWSDVPRYIISELDTYTKVEEREENWDMYALVNVTYVQLDRLPGTDNWEPLIDALREGRHFYSTGEILLEHSEITDGKATATFSWTFPLTDVELVYSDGENVTSEIISMTDTTPYGKKTVKFDFPEGMKWARVTATDIAGNSAFGQPVFLRKQG